VQLPGASPHTNRHLFHPDHVVNGIIQLSSIPIALLE